jgi:hypothetical protein
VNKKKQKNFTLLSASKRRFFEKKRAKNFIRLATPVGRRGQSLQTPGREAPSKSFFASFCSQKEGLPCFPRLGATTERDTSQTSPFLLSPPGGCPCPGKSGTLAGQHRRLHGERA